MVTKVLIGLGATGLTVGAFVTVYAYAAKTITIADLIKQHAKDKTFLNIETKNSEEGKDIWKKYRTTNLQKEKGKDKGGLSDGDKQHNNEASVPDSFVSLCESKINTEVEGIKDEKYTDFIEWCSK